MAITTTVFPILRNKVTNTGEERNYFSDSLPYLESEEIFNETGDVLRESDVVPLHCVVHGRHDLVRDKVEVKSCARGRREVRRQWLGVEERVVELRDVVERLDRRLQFTRQLGVRHVVQNLRHSNEIAQIKSN